MSKWQVEQVRNRRTGKVYVSLDALKELHRITMRDNHSEDRVETLNWLIGTIEGAS